MRRTSTGSSSRREPAGGAAEAVRAQLASLGLRPSRRLGQSFLTDPFVADIAAALLELPGGTPITEIGGGLGLLTEALLRRGLGPIRVLERDPRLASALRRRFPSGVEVVVADALEYDFAPDRPVAGNLPFSVASPILARLFAAGVPVIVAMLQKEVGERYTARAGGRSYGRPTLQAAAYGTAERFAPVPARAFEPRPRVEAVLVRFRRHPGPRPVGDREGFERLTAALFRSRRKQLRNLLPGAVGGVRRAEELARAAGWPRDWGRRRPEELPPEEFFALARARERDRARDGAQDAPHAPSS